MIRKIHSVYDVILKIIVLIYKTSFLNYIGIEKEIKANLSVEFVTLTGKKYILDFLCLLNDDTLCHIEFQYPSATPGDLKRFFDYNILSQTKHQKLTETLVFNFTSGKKKDSFINIGKSKSFHPEYFHLGDADFKTHLKNINIKSKSNTKLTEFEEITLMLICLCPEWENKFETLQNTCKLLKKKELFDAKKLEYIKGIIKLEIENLLTKREQKQMKEEIQMTPEAESLFKQVINEVHQKELLETREDALIEGRIEGRNEGRNEAIREIAKEFKDLIDIETLSEKTGLSIEEIEKL